MITLILILAFIRLAYYAYEIKEQNNDLRNTLKLADANYKAANQRANMWRDKWLEKLGEK